MLRNITFSLIMAAGTFTGWAQSTDSLHKAVDTAKPATPPSSPLSTPGMAGPLTINPEPAKYHSGILGDVYVSGVVSGLSQWQNNVAAGDRGSQTDLANGQVFIQKVDGVIQYFIQVGAYSLPAIGAPYFRSGNTPDPVAGATNLFFGVMPQAFLKIAPSANFSIMAGKLPTLIGAEYTWSFENMNIERGLLWNQENAVNRGVQVNYKAGPVAIAVSWNDGLYSNRYTWGWASLAWTINGANSLSLIGGGNTKITTVSSFATPLYLNNEQIYNLIYTHTAGPWTIEPYVQYTKVPKSDMLSTTQDATTIGGALFLNYAFHSTGDGAFNLPLRLEYINSTGSVAGGAPNLLYGQGSNAWAVTLTPTYQYKRVFARAELSYVGVGKGISGSEFGSDGTKTSQARGLIEIGMLF